MRNPFRRKTTELERFLTYLEHESSGSYAGTTPSRRAELEREQEYARIILDFAADTTVPGPPAATIEELLLIVSPNHEGWGIDRRATEDWIHRFRQQDA